MSQAEIAAVNRQFEDPRKGDLDRTPPSTRLMQWRFRLMARSSKAETTSSRCGGTIAQQIGLKDVRLNTLDFEQAGDTGYEVGEATLTVSSGTAVVKFVVVWKKLDGQWRLHRDIWNTKGA